MMVLYIYDTGWPKKTGQPMWPKFDQVYWYMYHEIGYLSRSTMIPKFPDSVEYGRITIMIILHVTSMEQDLSFQAT